MFLEIEELNTIAAEYKLQEIADYDDTILTACIRAAISRVRSYLSGRYDVEAIFSATGEERNADLLEICKNTALWFLIRRNNMDILYNRVKETFDRDMAYLKDIASGAVPIGLPLRETDGKPIGAIRSGSNRKFSHSW